MILSAQDHRDLIFGLDIAARYVARSEAVRFRDLRIRLLNHPIATTAIIQAVPTAHPAEQQSA